MSEHTVLGFIIVPWGSSHLLAIWVISSTGMTKAFEYSKPLLFDHSAPPPPSSPSIYLLLADLGT